MSHSEAYSLTYTMNQKDQKLMENEKIINQVKEWLEENFHTPWALMRLELMEEYRPEELERLAKEGFLMEQAQAWSEELTERHMELMRSGDYNHASEIGDEMRGMLIAEAQTPEWSVEELLERALYQNERLTEEQKEFLRESLPPGLAAEVDLLP